MERRLLFFVLTCPLVSQAQMEQRIRPCSYHLFFILSRTVEIIYYHGFVPVIVSWSTTSFQLINQCSLCVRVWYSQLDLWLPTMRYRVQSPRPLRATFFRSPHRAYAWKGTLSRWSSLSTLYRGTLKSPRTRR